MIRFGVMNSGLRTSPCKIWFMDKKKACLVNCELFGKHAATWESAIVPHWQGVYDTLVDRARIAEGSRVLDVGTGTGEVALRLSRLVGKRGSVVGVDAQPEMLQIAERKAKAGRFDNVEFREMSMEDMSLPDGSFDFVVGNYSLCCSVDYEAVLAECHRVLKPGGRLTYNHFGPSDPLTYQVLVKIFEDYKTKTPSKKLEEIREATTLQSEGVEKYRNPAVTLDAIRSVGFDEAEATLVQRVINYRDAGSFVDEWLTFDWSSEVAEIPPAQVKVFRKEAIDAISPLVKGEGFRVEGDELFFTGLKR
jgi:demethylmenaquinone methyltransferase/2-methoxy-6-polyprenyl-1,4-benzoquinol methylase